MPRQVVLLRHGHKDVRRGDYNLSPQGLARAIDLATLIPRCFGVPSQIRTYLLDPLSSKNARSYQTAVPLAVATGVNVGLVLDADTDSRGFGQRLLQDPQVDDRLVVLVWEHRRMPDLARGLGWTTMAPIAADNFDDLFALRYDRNGLTQVEHYSQSEMLRLGCRSRLQPRPAPLHP